ncbi:antibiotic ABC transporter permease [Lactobacillus sp. ESL0233]|nr:antibiotic ABC transporter permease [Lactobacillus sp. ESL0233]
MRYRLMLFKIGVKKGFSSKYVLLFYLFSTLISIIVQYFLWQAVLINRPVSEFRQTLSYLVLMQFLSVLFPKTSYDVNDKVQSGDIALDLLKPVAVSTQLFWESVGYAGAKFMLVGVVNIGIYLWLLDFRIMPAAILMVAVAGVLAYILYFELEMLMGTLSFYTYSIWGIVTFKEAILLILAGNVFPTYFYPAALRTLSSFLPFQYSFGAVGILAQTPTTGLFFRVTAIQLAYIVLFAILLRLLFRHAVTKTVIQGG